MNRRGVAIALATVVAPAMVSASPLVGIQFQGGGTALQPSDAAGVLQQQNFNVVTGSSATNQALYYSDSTGDTAPETLTFSADDIYGTGTGSATPNDKLLSGKVGTGTGIATFTLNSVPTGFYDLYVYAVNDTSGHFPELTLGSTTYAFQSQPGSSGYSVPPFSGTFIYTNNTAIYANNADYPIANYVIFPNVSPALDGTLTLTVNNIPGQSYYADINGLQLESVPEPASLGVLSLATLGALVRRRKPRSDS